MNPMHKSERKRLEKLQGDQDKAIDSYLLEKLTMPDLLLLLRYDPTLRQLIRTLSASESELPEPTEPFSAPPEPVVTPEPPVLAKFEPAPEPLRQQLAPELALLQAVQADAELAADWLGESSTEQGRQLVRLIARAAQWDTMLELWEQLALRCKTQKRAALPNELVILRGALALHNLRWQGRQAQLQMVDLGGKFDFKQHQRGTPTGERIGGVWLPGLINAGGIVQKLPLVETVT